MLIVGFPGETEQSVRNTVAVLNDYPTDGPGVHRVMFFTFAVLPLAEIASAQNRQRHNLRGYGYDWSHNTMDSRRAAELMARAQDALKPELSPPYVLEVPEHPGLAIDQIKRVFYLRNQIIRAPDTAASERYWAELERCFNRAQASGSTPDLIPQFA